MSDKKDSIAKHPVAVVIDLLLHLALIIALGLLLVEHGCDHSKKAQAKRITKELYYFKDARTGLCFAASDHLTSGYMATVDCKKVEKYLVKK